MVKIAVPDTINAVPLYYAMRESILPGDFKIFNCSYHEADTMLAENQVDIALLSPVDFANHPAEYKIIKKVCLAGSKSSLLPLLFFNKGRSFERIAVTGKNPSALMLCKIIVNEKFDMDAEFISEKNKNTNELLKEYDAVLVDDVDGLISESGDNYFDLLEEWEDFTALPFVFAIWAGRQENITPVLAENIEKSEALGRTYLPEIVKELHAHNGMEKDLLYKYLHDDMLYDFNKDVEKGLRKIWEYAFFYGETEHIPEIVYF